MLDLDKLVGDRVINMTIQCCVCGDCESSQYHLIMAPALFRNGIPTDEPELYAPLCSEHYNDLKMTRLLPDQVRRYAHYCRILPEHLVDGEYDYWGNPIIGDGKRMIGELFFESEARQYVTDESILANFVEYVKHPRTYHMPNSPGKSNDDKSLKNMDYFIGKHVVITEKMDGECTSLYPNYIHARSIDGRSHPSRDWVKTFHSSIKHDIPHNHRIVGENCYAQHSIQYTELPSYFFGFQVWDRVTCLDWDSTVEYFNLLGIAPVKVLYEGVYNSKIVESIISSLDTSITEGVVLRLKDSFHYQDYGRAVCKWVRKEHVQSDDHWMHQHITPNRLKKD